MESVMDNTEDCNGLPTLLQNILDCLSKLELVVEQWDGENTAPEKEQYIEEEALISTLRTHGSHKCLENQNLHQELTQHDSTCKTSDHISDKTNIRRTITCSEKMKIYKLDNFVAGIIEETKGKLEEFQLEARQELSAASLLPKNVSDDDCVTTTNNRNMLYCKVNQKLTALLSALLLQWTEPLERLAQHNSKLVVALTTCLNHLHTPFSIREEKRNGLCEVATASEREVDEMLASLHVKLPSKDDYDINNITKSSTTATTSTTNKSNSISETLKGNVSTLKCLILTLKDEYTNLPRMLNQQHDEVEELEEQTKYLDGQLQKMTDKIECMEDEKHELEQKTEQLTLNYENSLEELNLLQNQLKMTEDQRNMYLNETIMMKKCITNTKGHYHNLSDDKEKLLAQVKTLQDEKNTLNGSLQEQTKKTNKCLSEYNDIFFKCGNLEKTIAKLNQEYLELSGELKDLMYENDSLKNILQEKERDIINVQRNMRAVELRNTDLEDQLFHITGQYQTAKYGCEMLKTNVEEYKTMIEGLERRLIEVQHKNMNNKVDSKGTQEQSVERDICFVVPLYEKLLSTFMHQRNELVSLLQLQNSINMTKNTKLSDVSLSESEEYVNEQYCIIKSSYAAIKHSLGSLNEDWNSAEYYYRYLLCLLKIADVGRDDVSQIGLQKAKKCGQQVNSTVTNLNEVRNFKNLEVIVNKIKDLTVEATLGRKKTHQLKRKIKSLNRTLRLLQNKLKHYKKVKRKFTLHEQNAKCLNIKKNHHNRKQLCCSAHCNPQCNSSVHDVVSKELCGCLLVSESMYGILNAFSNDLDSNTRKMLTDACMKIKTCLITTVKILRTISCANGSRLPVPEVGYKQRHNRSGIRKSIKVKISQQARKHLVSSTTGDAKCQAIKPENNFKMSLESAKYKVNKLLTYLEHRSSGLEEQSKTPNNIEYIEPDRMIRRGKKEYIARKQSNDEEAGEGGKEDHILSAVHDIWIVLTKHEKLYADDEKSYSYLNYAPIQQQIENKQFQTVVRNMGSELDAIQGENKNLIQNPFDVSSCKISRNDHPQNDCNNNCIQNNFCFEDSNEDQNHCKHHKTFYYHNCGISNNLPVVGDNNNIYENQHSCTNLGASSEYSNPTLPQDTETNDLLSPTPSFGRFASILPSKCEYTNIMSSSQSHHWATCSKLARNVKTSVVSDKLRHECRSQCRNHSFHRNNETVYGLGRKIVPYCTTTDLNVTSVRPLSNDEARVLGRREYSKVRPKSCRTSNFSHCKMAPQGIQANQKPSKEELETSDHISPASEGYSIDSHDFTEDKNLDNLHFLSTCFQRKKRKKKFLHLCKK